jgi:hypothetical protein
MPCNANVTTNCVWNGLENQARNKVNPIANDAGRNSHGAVTMNNGTACQHWQAGDHRIFGTDNATTGVFTFIGWGQHVGRGNSAHAVNLRAGGKTRATTGQARAPEPHARTARPNRAPEPHARNECTNRTPNGPFRTNC